MAGERILIIDDTPVSLRVTQILLSRAGYDLRTAVSAEEAWETLRDFRPRLVLTDVQLPGIDGFELARRVKNDPASRGILVVAITASPTPQGEREAVNAGCDGYMAKQGDDLVSRIRGYLGGGAEGPTAQADFHPLRERFMAEVHQCVAQWRVDLDDEFDPDLASRTAHQWAGTAGLLGFNHAGRLARELEAALQDRPLDMAQLRDVFASLVDAFREPQ